MRRKLMIPMLIVAILSFGLIGMAQADLTATWQFSPTIPFGLTGDLGAQTFTFEDYTSGFDIQLPAHSYPDPGQNLYAKTNPDPFEVGLGLTNNVAQEINSSNFIQLDTAPMKSYGASDFTLGIGSIQVGEGFKVFGSNTDGTLGTELFSYVAAAAPPGYTYAVSNTDLAAYQYFQIQATVPSDSVSDVLILNDATATVVPIPAAVFLVGSGLLGLAGYGRSRKFLKS
jgi:hypothetical protein